MNDVRKCTLSFDSNISTQGLSISGLPAGTVTIKLNCESDNGTWDLNIDWADVLYGSKDTGIYRNLFVEYAGASASAVDTKVNAAVNHFFGIGTGESTTPTASTGYRVFYTMPGADSDKAFIWAPGSNDIRSEGMSYGMMIAVQMNKKTEFDKLWKFAKTYMQYTSGPWTNYFRWRGTVNISNASAWTVGFGSTEVPAPDGEEYFATALYFAAKRWGNGTGIFNYKAEADAITSSMLHK